MSKPVTPDADAAGSGHNGIAAAALRSVIERIERLAEERAEIADQIKEVYAEAKANGYDVKTLRRVIALRRQPAEERQEAAAMLDLYCSALGMLDGTPLGEAARAREAAAGGLAAAP